MKKFLLLFVLAPLAFFIASCELPEIIDEHQEVIAPQTVSGSSVLIATMADPATKTTITEDDGGLKVLWTYKDKLTVFYKGAETLSTTESGVSDGFTANGEESAFPCETATFSGSFPTGDAGWDDPYLVYAIYPYRQSGNDIDRKDGITTISPQLNSTQGDARVGATSYGIMVHVGRTTDASIPMKFYNMCSLLRFKVSNSDVRRVELSSDQLICGSFDVVFNNDGIPYITQKTGNSSKKIIKLYNKDNSAFTPGEWYYIALLPTTFTNGAKLSVYTSDSYLERNLKQGVSFERNHCKSVGVLDEGRSYDPNLTPKFAYISKNITNQTLTLWPEGSALLTATLSNNSGIDMAGDWTWESSNPTIATVVNGNVKPVLGATGETTITATTTYNNTNYTATCTIVVTNESSLVSKPFTVDDNGTQVYFAPGNLYLSNDGDNSTYGFNAYQGQIISYDTWDLTYRDKFKWWDEIVEITDSEIPSYTPREFTINNKKWKAPSNEQWTYILNHTRYVKAMINGVSGLILLPDTYSHPNNVTAFENVRKPKVDFDTNLYYGSDWKKLEQAGAVFLPAAGMYNSGFSGVGSSAQYLSCTFKGKNSQDPSDIDKYSMYRFLFSSDNVLTGSNYVSRYFPVRLVSVVGNTD